uniref:PHD finger protein 20 like 1 n=1 Tax=Salmo trutta TaxID=8032 RepID=A0A674B972_SALTR
MSKKTPNRPGITFEVGARIEAQDYLQKWYSSRIEDIDFDEGKMLVHFDRWSHRYDEWIAWDSTRLRPLERPTLRKEGLKEEEGEITVDGEEVLARWTDCRYYPAKIESVNKEGIYTVQFYDGVIRCVKKIHIKSMPHDAKGQVSWSHDHTITSGISMSIYYFFFFFFFCKFNLDLTRQVNVLLFFLGKKDKERRDRKEKDHFKMKQKKKKKKKRKSKQHCYSDYDDMSLSFLERSTASTLHRSSTSFTFPSSSSCSTTKHYQYPRAILSVDLTGENLSDIDFLEDSTTESLLFSGDEYNQDFDSLNMEDFQEEDEDGTQEIVRCICEMDEENGFMIQCEECMCWQHSVCMGLLEDSIPDQYICYICRDPPGQRWSAKYLHDKDWLNKGQMYGLSFLSENYSEQNCKTSVSTHQLLADVFSVNNVLHGLQLKMDILQNKHNPNLHFWARSWVNSDEDQPMGGLPDCIHLTDNSLNNQNSKTDTYITSEHRYTFSCLFNAVCCQQKTTALAVPGCLNERGPDSVEHARNCLQWQMNLLTHIEDVQNQVAGRMDLIEKELDVLESWLDFTGELEPPDPLARLPQLKHRIKQLLTDLSKVQQMSTLCSV